MLVKSNYDLIQLNTKSMQYISLTFILSCFHFKISNYNFVTMLKNTINLYTNNFLAYFFQLNSILFST